MSEDKLNKARAEALRLSSAIDADLQTEAVASDPKLVDLLSTLSSSLKEIEKTLGKAQSQAQARSNN